MGMGAHQGTVAKGKADAETAAWALAQRLGIFGYAEIAAELSTSMRVTTRMVGKWLAEGHIRPCGTKGHRKQFELTAAPPLPSDRASIVAEQLWNGMRGLKKFSPIDLAAHSRQDLRVDIAEARSYAQLLFRAGYLRVWQTAVPGEREAIYQLIRNTGPQPPREKRVVVVFDPNENAYSLDNGGSWQETGR